MILRFLSTRAPLPFPNRAANGHRRGQARGVLAAGLIFLASVILLPAAAPTAGTAEGRQFIQGRIVLQAGKGPVLRAQSKAYTLVSDMHYLLRTLADPRLARREVRLEGKLEGDRAFSIEQIFTVHVGKLYRVRYYCETCNIEHLGPGRCVCCQQPTELQEVPLDKNDHHIIVDR